MCDGCKPDPLRFFTQGSLSWAHSQSFELIEAKCFAMKIRNHFYPFAARIPLTFMPI